MGAAFHLKVVTPNGAAYEAEVTSLTANTEAGEITVLSEHCLLLSAVAAGRMVATTADNEKQRFALDTGFLEAAPDHVNIISENYAAAADLDADKLREEAAAIEARLKETDPAAPEAAPLRSQRDWIAACLRVAGER